MDSDLHLTGVQVGGQHQALHPACGDRLHPDALPDPGLRRVPDAARLQLLLATRTPGGVGDVAHLHHELVRRAVTDAVGDVDREGEVPAPVRSHADPVDEDLAVLVHGPEVDQHPVAQEPLRQPKAPAVPQGLIRLQHAPHPRQRGLRGEGHHDLAVPALRDRGAVGCGERVLPPAVEVGVRVAHQLGAWVLGQHVVRVEGLAPWRDHADTPRLRHGVTLVPRAGSPPPLGGPQPRYVG